MIEQQLKIALDFITKMSQFAPTYDYHQSEYVRSDAWYIRSTATDVLDQIKREGYLNPNSGNQS